MVDTSMFDNEATRSASDQLDQLLAEAMPRPRGRGRPAGVKNKPKVDEEGNFVPPRGRHVKLEPSEKAAQDRRIKEKQQLAERRERQLLNELNDQLLGLVVSSGVPAELLFKDGFLPAPKRATNPKYTELGQKIAIPPSVAKIGGMVWAEAESSSIGETLASAITADSPIRLIVLCLALGVAAAPWVKGVLEVRQQAQILMEAKMRYETEQRQHGQPVNAGFNQGVTG